MAAYDQYRDWFDPVMGNTSDREDFDCLSWNEFKEHAKKLKTPEDRKRHKDLFQTAMMFQTKSKVSGRPFWEFAKQNDERYMAMLDAFFAYTDEPTGENYQAVCDAMVRYGALSQQNLITMYENAVGKTWDRSKMQGNANAARGIPENLLDELHARLADPSLAHGDRSALWNLYARKAKVSVKTFRRHYIKRHPQN